MSTTIYYREGKGQKRDGRSRAQRFEETKAAILSVIEDAKRGDQRAKRFLSDDESLWNSIRSLAARKKTITPNDITSAGVMPLLANFSVDYANWDFIGDEILPMSPSDGRKVKYVKHDRRNHFVVQDNMLGGVHHLATEAQRRPPTSAEVETKPMDFQDMLDMATYLEASRQSPPFDELMDFIEHINEGVALKREIAQAAVVGTPANYPSANRKQILAGAKWDQAGGDMAADILDLKSKLWRGKGSSQLIAWCTEPMWQRMRKDPKTLKYFGLTQSGFMTEAQFVELFGLDGLLISEARKDTANIAKTATYGYIWPHHFGLARVSETPQLRNATFGYTFRWVPQMTDGVSLRDGVFMQQWWEANPGTFGSMFVKKAMEETYEIVASDTGAIAESPYDIT